MPLGFFRRFTESSMYSCSSLTDFIENKDRVRPTNLMGLFKESRFNGYATIVIKNRVNISREADNTFFIYDFNKRLPVSLDGVNLTENAQIVLHPRKRDLLLNGGDRVIYLPAILYSPRTDSSFLVDYSMDMPPSKGSMVIKSVEQLL